MCSERYLCNFASQQSDVSDEFKHWLYMLKNIHIFTEDDYAKQEGIFKKLMDECRMNNLTVAEMKEYKKSFLEYENVKKSCSLIVFFFFLSSFFGLSQAFAYDCLLERFVLTVYSMNGEYYAKSFPYSDVKECRLGKTEVYETRTQQLLYTVPACLTEGILFLSDDARTLSYVINEETHYKGEFGPCVTIYRQGELFKTLTLKELLDVDDHIPLYHSLNDYPSPESLYHFYEDTLFLQTSSYELLKIEMTTGHFERTKNFPLDFFNQWPQPITLRDTFTCEYSWIYELADGKSFAEVLGDKLGMKKIDYSKNADRYKVYRLSFELLIGTDGKCTILKLENPSQLPEDDIREIMSTFRFSTAHIPKGIDQWHFDGYANLRKKSKALAIKEKKEEQQKEREAYAARLLADSINGVYIPKNMEEGFEILDSMLKQSDIDYIMSFSERSEMIKLHFSLGIWIRNNWGLWGGSRFELYLIEKFGNIHPDDLSYKFLELYYDHLKEKQEKKE